jgi:hypothetical protein
VNSGYETADGTRVLFDSDGRRLRTSTFPEWWGRPPENVDERERWIHRNIREGEERMNRGERVEGQRVKTGRQARATLEQRRTSPAFANAIRMRLIELRTRFFELE